MDFLKQLGCLALASRLRRLADRLAQDVALLYREMNLDFEPRWFPVYYLLSRQSPMGVVDISRMLGISHPAVNQIAGELIEQGLVYALKDATDKRKRLLALTEKGQEILPALEESWARIQGTVRGLVNATGVDVMGVLEKLETIADEQGIYARFIAAQQEKPEAAAVRIVEYRPEYREAFRRLNLEWIEKYFTVEPEDEKILSDPQGEIVDRGGVILFALGDDDLDNEVLGTCALIKKEDGSFELAKMAVAEKARGRQIGKQLLAASIEMAKALEAEHLVLETNSQLLPAIGLYQKLGFVLVPPDPDSHYDRADTRMRLKL